MIPKVVLCLSVVGVDVIKNYVRTAKQSTGYGELKKKSFINYVYTKI
jgi:hypothetical protein